jgi:hypothetical protein
MPEEDLETAELKEKIDEDVERAVEERERAPSWTRYLSLSTAIIAVFAAVASLESGSNSNEAILAKSEAMLDQSRASDQWAFFQSKSVKAMLAEAHPDQAAAFKREGDAIQAEAKRLEQAVADDNEESARLMERHHKFAVSVTLLQIAIALSAIAALTRRRSLWYVGLAVSAAGLATFVTGFV